MQVEGAVGAGDAVDAAAAVAALERAELAARERRLAAEAEADAILAAAEAQVVSIEAGVGPRIDAALAELRTEIMVRAGDEFAALTVDPAVDAAADAAAAAVDPVDATVGMVVAAVLGETPE